jgi:hypothetical protein
MSAAGREYHIPVETPAQYRARKRLEGLTPPSVDLGVGERGGRRTLPTPQDQGSPDGSMLRPPEICLDDLDSEPE